MMADIRDLWECGDEQLRQCANDIIGAMGDQADLVGDKMGVLLEQFLSGKQPNLAGNSIVIVIVTEHLYISPLRNQQRSRRASVPAPANKKVLRRLRNWEVESTSSSRRR